ncbi:histidine phosphatase family protein [Paraburkholderia caffeinilytica]|uniref:histidine phosphatase family protein n=1 Tax=Paraburkholderia caffeinilytica TaxID=1761016 RepID=UPI0038B9E42D
MDLLLIRHGQSTANAQGLLISTNQDPLTDLGKTQSAQLAKTLERFAYQPSPIFCSPWRRAHETAQIVFGDSAVMKLDSRLAETNPGIYATWREADFNAAHPTFNYDITNRYEGGESHLDMADRVREWVDQEVLPHASEPGLAAAVAHGGPISVVLQHLLDIPIETRYPSFTVPNASFTYLKWRGDLKRYCVERVGQV